MARPFRLSSVLTAALFVALLLLGRPAAGWSASRSAARLAAMSVEQKVGQIFMVWFEGATVSPDIAGLIRDRHLGGVILYSAPGNIDTPEQVAGLTAGLQNQAAASGQGVGLLIGVDQEGAPVARLRRGFTLFPSQMAQAATGRADLVRQAAAATARELRAVGINVDFAPVADVNVNPANPVIGIRSFGASPADVARFTAAATAGYANAGMICTPKHFPGHGDTAVDSHVGLPRVDHDAKTLDQVDFPPFRAAFAADAPAVMTAHVVAPALTGGDQSLPATLSRRVLEGVLRGRMGFDGVIFTDSLGMGAVADTYGTAEAAVLALDAGADVLLVGADAGRPAKDRLDAMDAVTAAVHSGRIPVARLNDAALRVLRLKERFGLLDAKGHTTPTSDVAARVGRAEDAALAQRIAARSLTAFGPTTPTLPLSGNDTTLVIRPRLGREVIDVEAEAALTKWQGPKRLFLSVDPSPEEIEQAVAEARQAKAVALLVTDARRRNGQSRLAQALAGLSATPLVLVAAQSPYDLPLLPQAAVRLATYGEAPASLQALGLSLFSPFRFTGRLPAVLSPQKLHQ